MTTIAAGLYKKVSYARQTALGTPATGGSGQGKAVRRVTSGLDMKKASYNSQEIRPSQQKLNGRHGVRAVDGPISAELSSGTGQDFMESLLRKAVVVGGSTAANTTIVAAVTTANFGTLTRTGGSFITDGYKLGEVVRCTGFTAPATANNNHNMMIVGLTATVMTVMTLDRVPLVAKATGDSVVIGSAGKRTWVPQDNHTRDYYTFEHFFGDVGLSEVFTDCVISGANVKLPATGHAMIEYPVMGLDMTTGSSAYFSSPAAATNTKSMAAVNGVIVVNNAVVGFITNMDFNISGNYSVIGGVVGSNVDPDIIPGSVTVTGNLSVLLTDATMRDYFVNEAEFTLVAAFTEDNTPAANYIAFTGAATKVNGATKDDGEKQITLSMPFSMGEYVGGASNLIPTTLVVQDALFS